MPRLSSCFSGKHFYRAINCTLSALFGAALLLGDIRAAGATPESPVSAAPAQATGGDTVLHNNDLIRITVFGEDDLLTETRISKSGTITFPLLGALHLSGKTVDEATAEIRQKLDKDYVINPHVTLMVLEYATQWVTVLGEVQKPGTVESHPRADSMSLARSRSRAATPRLRRRTGSPFADRSTGRTS